VRLLVAGAHGQLGRELVRAARGHEVLALGADKLDITDALAVSECIGAFRPDVVVNAAAYTAVDQAEYDRDRAFSINRDGPSHLASACDVAGILFVHVSTDYVFDGKKIGAYVESDIPNPLSVYGASKLAGEEVVRCLCPRHIILRTSWVFSAHGKNFVKTMLQLGVVRDELRVVEDQHGCPTSAAELARGIMAVIERGEDAWGTYHFCQPEPTTWYDFSIAVFDEARKQGMNLKIKQIMPIATSDYPTQAVRPGNSVMDCHCFESTFGFKIQPWRESLAEVIAEILEMSALPQEEMGDSGVML